MVGLHKMPNYVQVLLFKYILITVSISISIFLENSKQYGPLNFTTRESFQLSVLRSRFQSTRLMPSFCESEPILHPIYCTSVPRSGRPSFPISKNKTSTMEILLSQHLARETLTSYCLSIPGDVFSQQHQNLLISLDSVPVAIARYNSIRPVKSL